MKEIVFSFQIAEPRWVLSVWKAIAAWVFRILAYAVLLIVCFRLALPWLLWITASTRPSHSRAVLDGPIGEYWPYILEFGRLCLLCIPAGIAAIFVALATVQRVGRWEASVLLRLLAYLSDRGATSRKLRWITRGVGVVFIGVTILIGFLVPVSVGDLFRADFSSPDQLLQRDLLAALECILLVQLIEGSMNLFAFQARVETFRENSAVNVEAGTSIGCDVKSGVVSIAHLSDLHMSVDRGTPLVEHRGLPWIINALKRIFESSDIELKPPPETWTNDVLKELVSSHKSELERVDFVLVTGDVTDTGAPTEWRAAVNVFAPFREKLIVCPGNHDLNILRGMRGSGLFHQIDTADYCSRTLQQYNVMIIMNAIHGDRALYWNGKALAPVPSRVKCLDDVADVRVFLDAMQWSGCGRIWRLLKGRWSHYAKGKFARGMQAIQAAWDEIFPMVFELEKDKLYLVSTSTSEASSHIFSNAAGSVRASVMTRLSRVVQYVEDRRGTCIHAVHHHVVPLRDSPKGLVDGTMLFRNSGLFMDVVETHGRTVVFHGHRHHEGAVRSEAGSLIISARSTTLGDERKGRPGPGFYIWTLGAGAITPTEQPLKAQVHRPTLLLRRQTRHKQPRAKIKTEVR